VCACVRVCVLASTTFVWSKQWVSSERIAYYKVWWERETLFPKNDVTYVAKQPQPSITSRIIIEHVWSTLIDLATILKFLLPFCLYHYSYFQSSITVLSNALFLSRVKYVMMYYTISIFLNKDRCILKRMQPLLAPWKPQEPKWQLSSVRTLFPEGNTAMPKFQRCSSCIYIICYRIWNMSVIEDSFMRPVVSVI